MYWNGGVCSAKIRFDKADLVVYVVERLGIVCSVVLWQIRLGLESCVGACYGNSMAD